MIARALWIFVALTSGCGGSSTADKGAPASGGTSGSGGSPPTSDGGTGSPGPVFGGSDASPADAGNGDCPESATLVYVTGQGDKLYSFYPPDQKFTLIGKFDCLTGPTHMTVDRQANAWVVAGGRLYKASTTNASCAAVSTWNEPADYPDFALTFIGVANTVDTTLFIMNESAGVATFDVASGTLTPVGTANIRATKGDMTSNGDGHLYFLHDVTKPALYELGPTDATTIASWPLTATGGGTQALAFWGGVFYAFENNVIYAYDPAKKTTTSLGNAPLAITGAGQSTCVPKTAPPPK